MTAKLKRRSFGDVFAFLLAHWRRQPALVLGTLACTIGATLLDVMMPIYAGRLIDTVANAAGANAAGLSHAAAGRRAAALLGVIALLGVGLMVLRSLGILGIIRVTLRMMHDVTTEAFWRVQRFSTSWHASSFAGSTVRQVTRGTAALDLLNDTVIFALVPALTALLGASILLGWRWPTMGVVVLASAAVTIVVAVLMTRWVAHAATLSNLWDTRLTGALADAITCNAVVKSFGAERAEDRRLGVVVRKWQRRTRRTWENDTLNFAAQNLALLGLRLAIIGAGVWLWWDGRAGPGDVAAVLAMYFVVQGYLQSIGQHIRNLQRSFNDMEELVAMSREPLGIVDAPDAGGLVVRGGRIVFQRVRFAHLDKVAPLFDGLELTIAAGERVGLVGHSGSGKSTLIKLLQRLHDLDGGRILIDGQDISEVTQRSLRGQIALVPQEPILFHRSLAENIGYARPGASMAEIRRVAGLANAAEFIEALPKGYRTLVGERGVKLSGGERQRVAIARALLADAPILVFDEATASLDSESEGQIQQAMARLMAGRTALVIAHRLATVRALDRIVVFEHGRIAEQGTHEGLIGSSGGIYRRLFELQSLGLAA